MMRGGAYVSFPPSDMCSVHPPPATTRSRFRPADRSGGGGARPRPRDVRPFVARIRPPRGWIGHACPSCPRLPFMAGCGRGRGRRGPPGPSRPPGGARGSSNVDPVLARSANLSHQGQIRGMMRYTPLLLQLGRIPPRRPLGRGGPPPPS